jgi:histidinol-phosphate/aromatic aminotransferase/cobyric acid decarboxylase-like protein
VAFVCNPNNPTGQAIEVSVLLKAISRAPSTLFVFDEAYADFVAGHPSAISPQLPENLVVLRSMTKSSALAGLRLGFAVGQPGLLAPLTAVRPSWNVNSLAQAAGVYAFSNAAPDPDVAADRSTLLSGLRKLGLEPLLTDCNFFLVPIDAVGARIAGEGTPAARLRRALLGYRCLVRDCTSFGLPGHVRISVRSRPENERLLEAFAAVLSAYH